MSQNPAPLEPQSTPTPSAPTQPVSPPPSTAPAGLPLSVTAANIWKAQSPMQQKLLLAGGIGLLVLFISTMLPWVSISMGVIGGSVAGTSNRWGIILLILSLLSLGAIAAALFRDELVRQAELVVAAIGVFAAVMQISLIFRIGSLVGMPRGTNVGSDGSDAFAKAMAPHVSAGIGLYLGFLGALAAAICFTLLYSPNVTKPEGRKDLQPLGIALGIGLVLGLLIGIFG